MQGLEDEEFPLKLRSTGKHFRQIEPFAYELSWSGDLSCGFVLLDTLSVLFGGLGGLKSFLL